MGKFDALINVLTRIQGLTGEARERRYRGLDWPEDGAETMIGVERLENVKRLALDVIKRGIPGDFMECGTWKGGCGILMAAIAESDRPARTVRIADSFEGCPAPTYPQDSGDPHSGFEFLRVSLRDVMENFVRYGLGNAPVIFQPGWFKDTLPGTVKRLALLRIDADMYESTTQALEALYDKVSPGGYVILDDYWNIPNCRAAIADFRERHKIREPIERVDWCAVYWQKQAQAKEAAA